MNLLEVRPTDTAGMNLYQHLARPNLRYRNRLNPNIVHTAIDSSTHGGRYCNGSRSHSLQRSCSLNIVSAKNLSTCSAIARAAVEVCFPSVTRDPQNRGRTATCTR